MFVGENEGEQDINIKDLVKFLKDNPGITKLSIANCKVSDEDVRELAKLHNLTSLDLRGNYISNKGARELANLTSLDLSNNGIGDKSAVELAKLTNLTSLDLRSNCIGYKGAAELLKKLTKLKELNLSNNDISYNDAKKLDKHISSVELLLSRDRNGNIKLSCNNFIGETLNKRDYNYWFKGEDITELAKHYYKWNRDNGVIFVDSRCSPLKQLDMWKNNPDRILISIVHVNKNHWVLLVAHQKNIFFVDSFGHPISKYDEAKKRYDYLNEKIPGIKIHDLLVHQQSDVCNCGVCALENARIIERVIKESNKDKEGNIDNINKCLRTMKETLKKAYPDDKDYKTRLNGKREEFALALKEFSTGKKMKSSIKNEKLSEVSTKNGKHGNYAAASFVLAVAFAVSASLTVPYLAICVALTVAAFAALAVGFYCLYKANTALNDVEADQVTYAVNIHT